jgi:hypothetical protein
MDVFQPFQDLVTVVLPSTGGELVQSCLDYLDLPDATGVMLRMEIYAITGNLYLEGAVTAEGPWKVLETWTSGSTSEERNETIQLATYPTAQYLLTRYLRWRFANGAGATVCFRSRYKVTAATVA